MPPKKAQKERPLKSGDRIIIFYRDAKRGGYIYSEPASANYNSVWFSQVTPPYTEEDPGLPDINCAAFSVLFPDDKLSTLKDLRKQAGRPIYYGQPIRLQHVATGMILSVNRSKSSQSGELGNLMVDLVDLQDQRANEDSVKFCFLLQYGGEYLGQQVRLGQPLKLESVEHPDHFLHCSAEPTKMKFGSPTKRHELNLSMESSSLTLMIHCTVEDLRRPIAIRSGEFVQISETGHSFHIAAGGAFTKSPESVYGQAKKYLGGWALDEDMKSWYPTSLWQIEDSETPTSGNIVTHNKKYRIKNILLRKYLAIEQTGPHQYKVVLLEWKQNDNDTVFTFIPLDQTRHAAFPVTRETWVSIKHPKTGTFLYINHDDVVPVIRDGLAGLQFELDLQLRQISASKNSRVSFKITSGDERVDADLYRVSAIIPFLKGYIEEKTLTSSAAGGLKQEICDLQSLIEFPLLRHLNVLTMLINILELLDSEISSADPQQCAELQQQIFQLLISCATKAESVYEKNHFATHVRFLWSKIGKGIKAEEFLLLLLQDNLPLLSSLEVNALIDECFQQLMSTKNPLWLHFLSTMSLSSGRAIVPNQCYVLALLNKPEFYKNVLYQTLMVDGKVCVTIPGSRTRIPLPELTAEEARFLQLQLMLCTSLCQDQNRSSIKALTRAAGQEDGLISVDELVAASTDRNIDQRLRQACIDLTRVMYIEGNEKASDIHGSTSWCFEVSNNACLQMESLAVPEEVSTVRKGVKDWIAYVNCSEEQPDVLVAMLSLLHSLVKNGFCTSAEDTLLLFRDLVCAQLFYEEVQYAVLPLVSELFVHQELTEVRDTVENFLLYCKQDGRPSLTPNMDRSKPISAESRLLQQHCIAFDMVVKQGTPPELVPTLLLCYVTRLGLQRMPYSVQLLNSPKSKEELGHIKESYGELKHYLSVAVPDSEQCQKAARILVDFSGRCYNNGIADKRNQSIYFKCVFHDALRYLLYPPSVEITTMCTEWAEHVNVIRKASLHFLIALARRNFDVQKRLFVHLDELLQLNIALEPLTELLAVMFAGAPPTDSNGSMLKQVEEIHMQVNEKHIEMIFQLLVWNDKERAKLVHALQYMAKFEELNLPISRNQELIIRNFLKSKGSFCTRIFGKGDQRKYRKKLLRKKADSEQSQADLQLLLCMTGLLASCAEGENLCIDTYCQGVFSLKEVLNILGDPDIHLEQKTPFLQFLAFVYIDCSESSEIVAEKESIWNYLEVIGSQLEKAQAILPVVEGTTMQQVLLNPWRQFEITCNGHSTEFEGILLHLTKGVLPMLQFFFGNVQLHGDTRILQISQRIFTSLWQLIGLLSKSPLPRRQLERFLLTAMTVTTTLSEDRTSPPGWQELILSCTSGLTQHSYDENHYSTDSEMEIQLNEQFINYLKDCGNFRVNFMAGTTSSKFGATLDVPNDPHLQEILELFLKHDVDPKMILKEALDIWVILKHEPIHAQLSDVFTEYCRMGWAYLELLKKRNPDEFASILQNTSNPYCKNIAKVLQVAENENIFSAIVAAILQVAGKTKDVHIMEETLCLIVSLLDSAENPMQTILENHTSRKRSKVRAALISFLHRVHDGLHHITSISKARLRDYEWRTRANGAIRRKFEMCTKSFFHVSKYPPPEEGANSGSLLSGELTLKLQLSILGLICDDQNRTLQNFMCSQPGQPDTINLVSDVAALLHHYRAIDEADQKRSIVLRKDDTDTICLSLQALLEFCGGNHYTQAAVVSQQFSLDISWILRNSQQMFLKASTIGLLEVLLEEICEESNEIVQQLRRGRLPSTLRGVMLEFYEAIPHVEGKKWPAFLNRLSRQPQPVVPCDIQQLDIVVESQPSTSISDFQPPNNSLPVYSDSVPLLPITHVGSQNVLSPEQHPSIQKSQAAQDSERSPTTDESHQLLSESPGSRLHADKARLVLYRTYNCTKVLEGAKEDKSHAKQDEPGPFSYCETQSRNIEVFYRGDEEREKIFTAVSFPFEPVDELREEVKEKLKWSVNRDTPEDKLIDFLQWMEAAKRDIDHQQMLRHGYGRIVTMFSGPRHYLLLFLTFLLNILILFVYMVPKADIPPDGTIIIPLSNATLLHAITPKRPSWSAYTLYILGAIHLLLALWMVLEYFAVNWPHIFVHGWKAALIPRFVWSKSFEVWKKLQPSEKRNEHSKIGEILEPPDEEYLEASLYGWKSSFRVVFLLASFLSLFYYGYFYCICMLYIIEESDILNRVLQAVTKNGKSLLWVGALGVLVLYIYAIISFAFIHEAFFIESESDLYCETLGQCFTSVIRYGLLDNLGLAIPLVSQEFSEAASRLLYDISFFIIVTTIGLNIVFGIIVDTFAELRDERYKSEEDMKDFCFICGIASHNFDRMQANGFQKHIRHHHSMWNYIYYYVYLSNIDLRDHTAIQKQVYTMMRNKQINFFPLRTAQGFSELTEQELIESTSETLTKKVDELGQDISKAMKQQNKQAPGAGKPQGSKTPDKTKDPDKTKKAAPSIEDVTTLKQQLHTVSQEISALREDVRFILHKFKEEEEH